MLGDVLMKGSIYEIRNYSYGFISVEPTMESVFFHKNNLTNCSIRQLEEGDVVEFDVIPGRNGGRAAINVRKVFQATEKSMVANPGMNPNVRLEQFNNDEKNIIRFLSKVFYVTSGGEEFKIGESTYRYCLIKPTEFFNRTFQLMREIVVIFCDYVSFEPRSLDAAAYVYKRNPSVLRLDRGCHLFICHDDNIENKLASLLKDSNLNQIVVPFTYRELLSNPSESMVQDRFKKYLFDTDLFSMLAPIQNDVFFFGRRDFAQDIASKCKNNAHSGVFGLRRSGKTSLLYAVQGLLRQQAYPTIYIPCESLSSLDWRTALCKVILDVYQEFNMDASNIHESDYRSPDTAIFFEEDMLACLKDVAFPLTIMFDEIEAITFGVVQGEDSNNIWYDGENFIHFWNVIKGYYSKYPKQLSIMVAGTNPMINEVPTIGENKKPNPMFRQLSESNQGAYLQAFTIDDTRHMVNTLGGYMGLSFDEYSVSKLTSDCGGHPYLMRILCSHINKYTRASGIKRPAVISKSIYDKAIPEFEKSSEAISFFWMILNILMTSYPKEYNILKVLALEGDAILAQIQEKDALFHLIGYGLVECNQNNYAIKYSTIARFLRGEYRFERQGLSVEEQKEEIQLRVNNAEMQLRTLVRNTLVSVKGKTKAKDVVLNAMRAHPSISSRDVKKAETLTYQELFDPSQNNMYFSLLKIIILDNLNVFENIFEGQNDALIKKNLDAINYARRCPDHSYTEKSANWSWANFVEFREGISWLESVISEYQ